MWLDMGVRSSSEPRRYFFLNTIINSWVWAEGSSDMHGRYHLCRFPDRARRMPRDEDGSGRSSQQPPASHQIPDTSISAVFLRTVRTYTQTTTHHPQHHAPGILLRLRFGLGPRPRPRQAPENLGGGRPHPAGQPAAPPARLPRPVRRLGAPERRRRPAPPPGPAAREPARRGELALARLRGVYAPFPASTSSGRPSSIHRRFTSRIADTEQGTPHRASTTPSRRWCIAPRARWATGSA